MRGPFYTKDGGTKMRLFKCCQDCAFRDYENEQEETEYTETCFMDPCPCMPIIDEDFEEEAKYDH